MRKVLLVEDNEDIALIVTKKIEEHYEVRWIKSGLDLVSHLRTRESADAVILDLMLPGRNGHELLNAIGTFLPMAKVFIFSSHAEYAERIPPHLIEGFFLKSDMDKMIETLRRVVP